jgi:hypothetical protein
MTICKYVNLYVKDDHIPYRYNEFNQIYMPSITIMTILLDKIIIKIIVIYN